MFKSVCYAYASSFYAKQFGRAATGCYYIEIKSDKLQSEPDFAYGPFETLDAAAAVMALEQGEIGPFCMTRKASA